MLGVLLLMLVLGLHPGPAARAPSLEGWLARARRRRRVGAAPPLGEEIAPAPNLPACLPGAGTEGRACR